MSYLKNIIVFLLLATLFVACSSFSDEPQTSSALETESESLANADEIVGSGSHDLYSQYEASLAAAKPEPETSLILYNTITDQIGDDMPPFEFKAYCQYLRRRRSDDPLPYIMDFYIINTETGATINRFNFEGFNNDYVESWRALGIPAEYYELKFIDVDFDGYKDLIIDAGPNGTWNKFYIYYIWAANKGSFIEDPYGLGAYGLPKFDEENQIVHSMTRGSALDHWFYKEKYIDGVLTLIEERAENAVWELIGDRLDESIREKVRAIEPLYDEEKTIFFHGVTKQLNMDTMEMIVVEDKYKLYLRENYDYIVLAEYDFDSDMGLILKEYV